MEPGLLEPRYAERFHCIGANCEDSCCQGWGVFVDKATYKKYRGTLALRRLAAEHIQVDPQCSDELKYGRVKLKADGSCPFLNTDKLCSIQREHGSEYLSEVCARYPRVCQQFDQGTQTALYLSCPEAARQVLLSPELISIPESIRYRDFTSEERAPSVPMEGLSISTQLRSFALRVIQDRSYPLWQRLFLLGTVCRRTHELTAAGQDSSVAQMMRQYAVIIVSGDLRAQMEGIPARPDLQVPLVFSLIQRRFEIDQPPIEFAGCVANLLQTIGYSPQTTPTEWAAHYRQAYLQYYKPFSNAHPNLLENYLINYIYRTRLPFADTVDKLESTAEPACSYSLMVFHYRLLESLLIGAAARYRPNFSVDHAVKLTKSFAKAIEHHAPFLESLKVLIRSGRPLSTDDLAVLLRN